MRIAFDVTTAAFEQRTGTGVYCKELVEAYQKEFFEDRVFHTYRMVRWLKGRKCLLPLTRNARTDVLIDPFTFYKGRSYDVFHGLNTRLPMIRGSLNIATVHDLFSIFGEFSNSAFLEDQKKKLQAMIARAHHVIVPASYTKAQMVERLNMKPEKITVVGEGVREAFLSLADVPSARASVKSYFNIQNPYLIFVGTLEKRKNVLGLIDIFNQLKTNHDLVLVGGEGFEYNRIALAIQQSPKRSRIHRLGYVDTGLPALYQAADAMVYPSFEEGYGIPIIEAMACGIPVVSSNTTSMPEVGNGHTWLFSPTQPEKAVQILNDILTQNNFVRSRTERARRYAQTLTWSSVARKTRDVYVDVLGRFKSSIKN